MWSLGLPTKRPMADAIISRPPLPPLAPMATSTFTVSEPSQVPRHCMWIICAAKLFPNRTEYRIVIRETCAGRTFPEEKSGPFSIWRDGTRDTFTATTHGGLFFNALGDDYPRLKFLDPAEDRSPCEALVVRNFLDYRFSWTRWGYAINGFEPCELPRNKEVVSLERVGMPGYILRLEAEIPFIEEI